MRLWSPFVLFRITTDLGAQTKGAFVLATSKLQQMVGRALRLTVGNALAYENYRPYWMTDRQGRRLELDFYLPDYDLAIEVQGI